MFGLRITYTIEPTLSQPVIQETLNEELELIGTWLRDNSLFLNTSKTESMLFGTHAKLSRATDFSIMINGRTSY